MTERAAHERADQERYAIYFAPEAGSPLWAFGTSWLGRDPETGDAPVARFGLSPEIHTAITAAPRRYGFHATLKPPFRLMPETTPEQLTAALQAFAAERAAFDIPAIRVDDIDGFLAFVPARPVAALEKLAGDCVTAFDGFRAPSSEAEIARRRPHALSPRQREYLDSWGYPYVLEEFRFHMTLTERLEPEVISDMRARLDTAAAHLVGEPVRVSELALYAEREPGAPFRLQARFPFGAV